MDFALDANGDLLIENNTISMVVGAEHLRQKVWTILHTNLQEWFFDWDQGIDFDNLLGKGTNAELARFEIVFSVAAVAEIYTITDFEYAEDRRNRTAKITFRAQTESGEEVGGEYTWA